MKLPIAATLPIFLAFTKAALADICAQAQSINDCGTSSFQDQTTAGSPYVSDCLTLAYNILNGGAWTCYADQQQRQLAQYGTCAFGVQSVLYTIDIYKIGNQDIIDLIHSSISYYEWDGKVGAKGNMWCNSDAGTGFSEQVMWGIYHT